ncbi:hypothetical protein MPTK1_3g18980 [Marchantia polymorpha subsp. ruderalis]|nr:hypothetical protein MARPO_0049s0135 [Marchantia polymorpha]BBN06170.1 hypothetical protein Mp_3g18980 [Marchantia polymorpha subsp. ruderalis]|eukprot:PTQ38868.1 hypothetical protein MARPO_0049s0135 [Marchantia polymorpha]
MASMACRLSHQALILPPRGSAGEFSVAVAGAQRSVAIGRCSKPEVKSLRLNQVLGRRQKNSSSFRRAVGDEESGGNVETPSAAETSGTEKSRPAVDKKAAARAEVQRGKNTALITGAISVLLGVGYLVLIQLLDTRGIELIPPPPEAFDP